MEIFNEFLYQMQTSEIFAYSIIIIYSLFIGSFLNVVIYRLPIMMTNEYLTIVKDITNQKDEDITKNMSAEDRKEYFELRKMKDINLAVPSSRCCSCGKKIPIYFNIPILSYLMLRGKCFYCKQSYSPQYLFIEAFISMFWCFSYYHFGLTIEFLILSSVMTALIASFFIDIKYRLLPDSITAITLFTGLYYNIFYNGFVSPEQSFLGAVVGYIVIYTLIKTYEKIRKLEIGMGEGDIKLFAACGAWIGLTNLPFLVVVSCIIGLIQFICLIPFKKKIGEYQLPFGPAIIVTFFLFTYFNEKIITTLTNLF